MRQGSRDSMQALCIQLIRVSAPAIIAITVFDRAVTIEGGSFVRTHVRTRIEQSCRSMFRRGPRDVPAEIISGIFWVIFKLVSDDLVYPQRHHNLET